ncbi:MAG: DNA repair protein RecN [Heliobacteriaceae bacterium]|nr:DNA repair protein RecN [Heliobacteriaceae bacterium]
MLERLRVENLALIELVELNLSPGLNLLTGETGAGKSLVIDAVNLLIGGRANSEVIRTEAVKARIEGLFRINGPGELWNSLAELGVDLEEDDCLLLTREISRAGKSVCRINGRSVPVSVFREVGGRLLDLQGQHEQQSLLNPRKHCLLVDRLTGTEGEKALTAVGIAYRDWQDACRQIERLEVEAVGREERLASLTYQKIEIENARLQVDEDLQLENEYKRLQNSEKMITQVSAAHLALTGEDGFGILDLADRARQALLVCAGYDDGLGELVQQAENIYYQSEELARQLVDYRTGLEFQPGRLEEVGDRLDLIRRLKRKYGNSVAEILQYGETVKLEIAALEQHDEQLAELRRQWDTQLVVYNRAAAVLSRLRRDTAAKLQAAIEQELAYLGMPQASLTVQFSNRTEPAKNGAEDMEFLFTTNPGEPVRPLARIASGGELARILLAFKTVLAGVEGIPTLIFDEIDTGIGGQALQAVAEKLAQVAGNVQVICVTHAPQLAAYADTHFLIYKEVCSQRTIAQAKPLNEAERINELARMLAGEKATTVTFHHAREMVGQAKKPAISGLEKTSELEKHKS